MTEVDPTEEANRRSLWRDVGIQLGYAQSAIEYAQGLLEDLHLPEHADLLQPHVDAIRQAATEAMEAGA